MPDEPRLEHGARLTRREALLFEAGVKLGGVFHQYLGTPVAPSTADHLARTIERAVRLQPYVRKARVRIDPGALGDRPGEGRFAYGYLRAEMLDVTVELADGGLSVVGRLAYRPDLRYPLMRIESIRATPASPTSARRRARK
jgi:hypothetical protein